MVYDNVDWMSVDDHDATTGNGYVTHICEGNYKGRVQRTGYTTVTTEGTTPATATINFIQLGESEYVTFDSSSYSANAAGGTITITGRTNSATLRFALTADANSIGTLPTYFTILVGSTTTQNQAVSGQTFAGDPGASQEIQFTIIITIAANTTVNSRYCTLTAYGSNSNASCNIIQAAGSSYIWVEQTSQSTATVTFTAAGTSGGSSSVDTDVLSNDSWSVNVTED